MPSFRRNSDSLTSSRTATAIVLGAIALSLIGLGATAPRAHSATRLLLTEHSPEVTECPTRIGQFRQADVWYRGRNRILVEAQSACGSRYGDALDLTDVQLTIVSGDHTYAILHSPFGTYDQVGHQLLLGPAQGKSGGCLQAVSSLLVDLKSGELRVPGLLLALASPKTLPGCEKGGKP